MDVTAPEATKGHALAWRAEQLGLTRDEVMAVGDNFNDLEMLEFAGTPVVMGNAVDGAEGPRLARDRPSERGRPGAGDRAVLR